MKRNLKHAVTASLQWPDTAHGSARSDCISSVPSAPSAAVSWPQKLLQSDRTLLATSFH